MVFPAVRRRAKSGAMACATTVWVTDGQAATQFRAGPGHEAVEAGRHSVKAALNEDMRALHHHALPVARESANASAVPTCPPLPQPALPEVLTGTISKLPIGRILGQDPRE